MAEVTGAGTHIATQAGYAEGRIIEAGEIVPTGIPVPEPDGNGNISGNWMAPVAEAPAEPADQA